MASAAVHPKAVVLLLLIHCLLLMGFLCLVGDFCIATMYLVLLISRLMVFLKEIFLKS